MLLTAPQDQYRVVLDSNAEQIEHLKLTIEKLRRQLFGAKSEKVAAELEQFELELDELETAQACRLTMDTAPAQKRRRSPGPSVGRFPNTFPAKW